MTPHPQQCDCLSAVGMSVECLDSYCPSHHKCDHVIKPSCWDIHNIATERVEIPHYCFGIARDDSGEDDVCENCAANCQCMAASDLLKEKISERDKVLDELRKIVVELYDEGFKTPLATFDAAVSKYRYGDIKLRTPAPEQP